MKNDDISKILQKMKSHQDAELLKAAEAGFNRRNNPPAPEQPIEPEETLSQFLNRIHERQAKKTLADLEEAFRQRNKRD